MTIEAHYDRYWGFYAEIVKKWQTVLVDSLAPKIISLYGKGMSLRDIGAYAGNFKDLLPQFVDKNLLR